MTEKPSANSEISKQQSTATITTRCLGIGRGKAQPETNNYAKWNSTDG
ncbi:unnamed protein product, partial [Rotaria sp. Silwood1]